MKAKRRWRRKLHQDEKWQALTNHCSDDCSGSDRSKIWLHFVKYKLACKRALNAATCCNRFEHTEIITWTSLSVMCLLLRSHRFQGKITTPRLNPNYQEWSLIGFVPQGSDKTSDTNRVWLSVCILTKVMKATHRSWTSGTHAVSVLF